LRHRKAVGLVIIGTIVIIACGVIWLCLLYAAKGMM
jgi:cell division septation protein DedD